MPLPMTLENEKGFCAVVTTQDIAKQDYILTAGRYVGIEEQEDDGEPFEEKMGRLTSELSELFAKSHELEAEIIDIRIGRLGMTSEWKTSPLRDLVGFISKGIAPSYTDEESETTVRVLNQKCNRNFQITYSESRLHDLSRKKVSSGEVCQN